MPVVVLDDYTRHVSPHPELLERYVCEIVELLSKHAAAEIEADLSRDPVSPLWSLFNGGLVALFLDDSEQSRIVRNSYGPHLRKIEETLLTWRP